MTIQVSDIPYCPRCRDDGFWRIAPANAEGFETLRCVGCGRDYLYKRPEKVVDERGKASKTHWVTFMKEVNHE